MYTYIYIYMYYSIDIIERNISLYVHADALGSEGDAAALEADRVADASA